MINFDKFLASFITETKKHQPITSYNLPGCIKKALDDQGLEYKDGEIVKTQRRISAEAKENGYNMSDDDRIREALIHFFSNSENTSFEYWEGISKKEVLVWLEKQGDHKLAWSEEDEERLQSCLNILQVQAKGFMGITETINTKWLKSLKQRHTWKPSDEQINSLEYIIDNAQYLPYSHSVVNELLEQLKKLKRG